MAGESGAARAQLLSALIRDELAAVLGYRDAAAFPAERAFTDLGFDSLATLQLRDRLSILIGVRLPGSVVLDHPTLRRLTDYIDGELAVAERAGTDPVRPQAPDPGRAQ